MSSILNMNYVNRERERKREKGDERSLKIRRLTGYYYTIRIGILVMFAYVNSINKTVNRASRALVIGVCVFDKGFDAIVVQPITTRMLLMEH